MCGIFGLYTIQPLAEFEQRLKASLESLSHRGPDEQTLENYAVAGGTLVFGHARLSIIDLSPGGRQPKHSEDGRLTMIFNGEIYNYRELRQELQSLGCIFHTNSDTEVLVACWKVWGERSLQKLRGMFAFATLDRREKTLTLVRDAFGIKPLFYRVDGQGLVFASEIKALLPLMPGKPRLNHQRAYDYLTNDSYDDSEETFFDGIYHLLPGHILTLNLDELSQAAHDGNPAPRPGPFRWWRPGIEERIDISFDQATEQLREMFLHNVRLHLRSDVPVGAALSGGIDSSAVVCAIHKEEPDLPIQTFSYVARGSAVDEERWVDIVNAHVGAVAHKIVLTTVDIAEDIDDLIATQGEPFGGTSIYAQYRVFKLAREHGIIVTMDGQGADELLAGYHGYHESRMHSLVERGEIGELIRFVQGWSQWPGRSLTFGVRSAIEQVIPHKAVKMLRRLKYDPSFPWMNYEASHNIGIIDASNDLGSNAGEYLSEAHGRRLAEALRSALNGKGLSTLLRHGDRNSMRWSIESRVPFLTQDIAEFVLTLPEHYLISKRGETKHIFRSAMRGIVPDIILDRKDKVGFATPEHGLIKIFGDRALKWIESAERIPYLRPTIVRDLMQKVVHGDLAFGLQYWRLLNFCRWLELSDPAL